MNVAVRIILLVVLWVTVLPASAQTKVSLGFYNLENLYDTVPSLFHDDSDYTPGGRLKWNSEKYNAKLSNIARVLDEMSLDIVGVAEIESEQAVRDLVGALSTDYNYVHRNTGDFRGMDLAVLYKGDKFVPVNVRQIPSGTSREFLYIIGELYGERIDLVVCHMPSQLNRKSTRERAFSRLRSFADSLHRAQPDSRLVVMGDFNATINSREIEKLLPRSKGFAGTEILFTPFAAPEFRDKGTYVYRGRWLLYDNIFLSSRFMGGNPVYADCGIFIRPYLISREENSRKGYPRRTFERGIYAGGYSDHLPVFVYLEFR